MIFAPDEARKICLKLGSEIGRLEGMFAGKRWTLECIPKAFLDAKLDNRITEKIEMATLKQLDRRVLPAATARTIEDVFLVPARTRPEPGGANR